MKPSICYECSLLIYFSMSLPLSLSSLLSLFLSLKIGRLVVQTTALFVMNGFPETRLPTFDAKEAGVPLTVDALENHYPSSIFLLFKTIS